VTDRVRRNGETAIGGRYATRRMVLTPGVEQSATGVSLPALTECVHSDPGSLTKRKCFLLMRDVGCCMAECSITCSCRFCILRLQRRMQRRLQRSGRAMYTNVHIDVSGKNAFQEKRRNLRNIQTYNRVRARQITQWNVSIWWYQSRESCSQSLRCHRLISAS
jgi:hypothetical protein